MRTWQLDACFAGHETSAAFGPEVAEVEFESLGHEPTVRPPELSGADFPSWRTHRQRRT